jgi:hypothetical protein
MDFTFLEGSAEEPQTVLRQRGHLVKEGDLVIVMERHDSMSAIYAKAGETFQNRFGAFHHDDIIGQPYGSKVRK